MEFEGEASDSIDVYAAGSGDIGGMPTGGDKSEPVLQLEEAVIILGGSDLREEAEEEARP